MLKCRPTPPLSFEQSMASTTSRVKTKAYRMASRDEYLNAAACHQLEQILHINVQSGVQREGSTCKRRKVRYSRT